MNGIQQWLQFFEQVGCFHREMYMLPLWRKYRNHPTDIWDSLSIFLEGYAFERQGRRPDYSHAGVDALLYCRHRYNNNFTQNLVSCIWQRFSQLLNNQRLNHRNNPLYPSTNPNNLQNISQSPSVIEVVLRNGIIQQNLTFTTFLQNQIIQSKNVRDVFRLVKGIRGIGDKVAPLYLRDLVDVMNIPLNNIQDRHLLQPIDIWVERTVKILTNNQAMNRNQVATWIVNSSRQYEVNPQRINMGIWFFCSNIAGSEYKLRNTLNNLNIAQNLVNNFRANIKNVCNNC